MRNENRITLHENKQLRERYWHIEHKSGLDIYVFPKKMSTTYALLATKYGSIDNCFRLMGEKEYRTVPDGIAHFLEHKMFESEDGRDTFERFAMLGGSANAFTSNDMTAYEFSCTEHVYENLEVLLDFVTHPYFTEENVKKEQGIIGQEIQMCDDNPMRRLYQELLQLLYVKDNTRINICGTMESIAQITPEHLYNCYHTFYRLSNMALVVCGDATYEGVIQVADKVLPCEDDVTIERYFEAEPQNIRNTRSETKMTVSRPLFAIGVKDNRHITGDKEDVKHALILRIVADLLFGASGEFYNTMYNEGLLNQTFDCGYESSRTCGFFLLWGEADDPELIFKRVQEWIRRNQSHPPSYEDFIRIKRNDYAAYIRTFDSTEGVANDLLADLFAGVDIFEAGDILSSITYEDVCIKIKTFFKADLFSMSIITPVEEK